MLILASNSPRRRELIKEVAECTVVPSRYRERDCGLSANETALLFATGKAEEVFSRFPGDFVLGADTVVSLGGETLGKPVTPARAAEMLRKLSGRTHEVITGICLLGKGFRAAETVRTEVDFFELSEALIEEYVATGLPLDKAGAYGIQDGFPLVREFRGSYTNVVGLPVEEVRAMWKACGGYKC